MCLNNFPCWKLEHFQGFLKWPSGSGFTVRTSFSLCVKSTELHYWFWAGMVSHKYACLFQTSQCRWIKPCSCLEVDVASCYNQPTCGTTSLTPLTRALCVVWSHFPSRLRFVLVRVPNAINPAFDPAGDCVFATHPAKLHEEKLCVHRCVYKQSSLQVAVCLWISEMEIEWISELA